MVNSSLTLFSPSSVVSVEEDGCKDSEFSDGGAVRVEVALMIFFPPTILMDRFHEAVDGPALSGVDSVSLVEDDMFDEGFRLSHSNGQVSI